MNSCIILNSEFPVVLERMTQFKLCRHDSHVTSFIPESRSKSKTSKSKSDISRANSYIFNTLYFIHLIFSTFSTDYVMKVWVSAKWTRKRLFFGIRRYSQ